MSDNIGSFAKENAAALKSNPVVEHYLNLYASGTYNNGMCKKIITFLSKELNGWSYYTNEVCDKMDKSSEKEL